ncbi:MAG: rhodanese-like domain-containing protein [Steroidobacteraceae bacterium]
MERLLEYLNRHPILVGLVVVLALAVIVYELRGRKLNYAAVLPQEAIQLMNQGAHTYDLRTTEAFAAGHISNARNLDASKHDTAADTLKKFREKLLLLYCEDGRSSTALTRKLHAAGFTKVFNLRGGLAQWRSEGLPLQRG